MEDVTNGIANGITNASAMNNYEQMKEDEKKWIEERNTFLTEHFNKVVKKWAMQQCRSVTATEREEQRKKEGC
mgnify:CR=1 FL=1